MQASVPWRHDDADRQPYTALGDRMLLLLVTRAALASIVMFWGAWRPEVLTLTLGALGTVSGAYLALSLVAELARRRFPSRTFVVLSLTLLLDGIYLAGAMYVTGGTQSPMRFLVYLHVVAASLLASYRTGLKVALWHSLLLFVVLYAQAASLLPAVDVTPGAGIAFERMPVLNVTSFWLFAIATSVFSAMNERELRARRIDLQSLVEISSRLDTVTDPIVKSRLLLEGLSERFGFERGVVLGASEGRAIVLASCGTADLPSTAADPDQAIDRAWRERRLVAVKRLDPAANPLLGTAFPDRPDLVVSPMIADGEALGAVVVAHRSRRGLGLERRIATVLTQLSSMAALNLRNAVLLRNVQDLAERDTLTGAANRRVFQSTLERVLAGTPSRSKRVSAVLFIDLDDFKVVNDTLGHAAGDALLVDVAERISRSVREKDLVARLGGDEFAVLTEDAPDLGRAVAMAERLTHELGAPYVVAGHPVVVTASIGIAGAVEGAVSSIDVVRNADLAMYMAKANGKARFALFDPGMTALVRERHELASQLLYAVERGQLRVVYQPIVSLASGAMEGLEALVRWDHPERGLIPPGDFIELAEENGAILPIGRWVLGEACRRARAWAVGDPRFLCVNVSAREIQQPDFVDSVRHILAEAEFDPTRLSLEITETALLRTTPTTVTTLESLRGMGVRIVIDDFGTGYFSLSHLRQFPVDALKIASEFVQVPAGDAKSAALAEAIVAMSASLRIETVAEGIETAAQAERMRALGCTYGQGYFFARPLEADAVVSSPAAVEPRRARRGGRPSARAIPVLGQALLNAEPA